MNGQNSHNLLNSSGAIALVFGLVTCVTVGVLVNLKGEDQKVAIGAGAIAGAVAYGATWLQQRGSQPGFAENRVVQVQLPQPQSAPHPSPRAPIQQVSLPDGFQPTGKGKLFYVEAVSSDWTADSQPAQIAAPLSQPSQPSIPLADPAYPQEVITYGDEEEEAYEYGGDEAAFMASQSGLEDVWDLPDLTHDFSTSSGYRR